jgi:hypothetical protein
MEPAELKEILILSKQNRLHQPAKDRKEVLIRTAALRHIVANETDADARLTQPQDFEFGDVLVDEEHGAGF